MAIFSNFFVNINTHIIRCNAGEKITSIFELFNKQKIGFRFVLFLSVQTLLGLDILFASISKQI
jgi:hypothetical protein